MYYYTYLIKFVPTSTFYYGKRTSRLKPADDLWVKYFTSSAIVKKLIQLYGVNSFEYEIRRVFTDQTKMNKWEAIVLKRMKVVERTDFMNQHVPVDNFIWKSPPFKGNHHPLSVREKISKSVSYTKQNKRYTRPDNIERNKQPNFNKQKGTKKPEISLRNSGAGNGRARTIITPKGVFLTRKEAALAYDVWEGTIRDWIKKGKDGFYYG